MLDALGAISESFKQIGDNACRFQGRRLDPEIANAFAALVKRLEEKYVFGLEESYNRNLTLDYLAMAKKYYEGNQTTAMFTQCCYGVAETLSHSELFYLAAKASAARGAIPLTIVILKHVLWINHGDHPRARADLDFFESIPEGKRHSWKPTGSFNEPPLTF